MAPEFGPLSALTARHKGPNSGGIAVEIYDEDVDGEQVLTGGNASDDVVRVGSTVRKPWTNATPSVIEFMSSLRAAGLDVPAALGRDEQGRQIIEFIPGTPAIDAEPLTHAELSRVGAMVRTIHDASAPFVPASDAAWEVLIPAPTQELICHNDLAPWNLILGERWTFIDWDGAGPSTRLWDLAYAAQAFTLSDAARDPRRSARSLAAFVDGYEADRSLRAELPAAMHRRAAAMHQLLRSSHESGRQPWGSMYVQGHGTHWREAALYVARHQALWSATLLSRAR